MSIVRVLVVTTVVLGALAVGPAAAGAASAPQAPTEARSASLAIDGLCKALEGSSVETATRRVIERGAGNRWYGPLLASAVLESARYLCPPALALAQKVVLGLFRTGPSPGALSTAATWNLALPDLGTAQTAAALGGVSPAQVSDAVTGLCADVRDGSNLVSALVRFFPSARLKFLRGLNSVVSLAARNCNLAAYSISALSSSVLQLVLSRESAADVDPPAVWFTSFASRGNEVTAYFAGSDRGAGLARFVVWIGYNGAWRRLTTNAAGPFWRVALPGGVRTYKWAVQAIDRAGNSGPVAYSTVGSL